MTGQGSPEAGGPASGADAGKRHPAWVRPRTLGYHESLRGLGGIVSPLLAGFSLATIATLVTSENPPPLAEWAVAALALAITLLLYSMQTASQALTHNPSPQEILNWRPEATVSVEELQRAREAQAADFAEMARLGGGCSAQRRARRLSAAQPDRLSRSTTGRAGVGGSVDPGTDFGDWSFEPLTRGDVFVETILQLLPKWDSVR